jgi:hypothetical protein
VNTILTEVSRDLRSFLSFFTKIDCLPITPKEFLQLPQQMNPLELKGGEVYIFEHADTLYRVFAHCDELRFSGNVYGKENVLKILDSMNHFVSAFESYEKEKPAKTNPRSFVSEAAS